MINIKTQLEKEFIQITDLIKRLQVRLKNAPEGTLNTNFRKNQMTFYHYLSNKNKQRAQRRYIKKDNLNLAKALAQKQYDLDLLEAARAQEKVIRQFMVHYEPDVLKQIYGNLAPERKSLIIPEVVDDETFAIQWQSMSYTPSSFSPNTPVFKTLKGEYVRSKTEKIIADTLYAMGIPYRYEFPLKLKDGRIWRPDFTILNKRTRQEYYLEHFGMMDDPQYCSNAIGKISIYMQNQIFPGEKLLLTMESREHPFSATDLELLINHYLL